MVAHLTANQQPWVQIQLLPSTRKTLSVLRWVATWDDTVGTVCWPLRGGRGTYTQKPIKIYRGQYSIHPPWRDGSACSIAVLVVKSFQRSFGLSPTRASFPYSGTNIIAMTHGQPVPVLYRYLENQQILLMQGKTRAIKLSHLLKNNCYNAVWYRYK